MKSFYFTLFNCTYLYFYYNVYHVLVYKSKCLYDFKYITTYPPTSVNILSSWSIGPSISPLPLPLYKTVLWSYFYLVLSIPLHSLWHRQKYVSICFSFFWLYLAWHLSVLSTLEEKARLHLLSMLNNIPLCVYVTSSLYTHLPISIVW